MPSITPRELIREALRSFAARRGLVLLTSLAVGALCLGGAAVEAHAYRTFATVQSTERERGADVLVIDAEGAEIPAHACDALGRSSSATGIGTVGAVTTARLTGVGAFAFQRATVDAGYLGIVAPDHVARHPGIVGSAVADSLGIRPGSALRFTDGTDIRIGATLPGSTRTPDRDRWIFAVVPHPTSGGVVECWVESASGRGAATRAQIAVQFGGIPNLRVRSAVANDTLDAATASYDGRITQWIWLATGGVSAGLVLLALRVRQPEYALYRIVGLSVRDVALLSTFEAWLLIVAPALVCVVTGLGFLATAGTADAGTVAVLAANVAGAAAAACALIAAWSARAWSADIPRLLKTRG